MRFLPVGILGILVLIHPLRAQTTSAAAIKELMAAVKERHDAAEEALANSFKLMNDYHSMVMASDDVQFCTKGGLGGSIHYSPGIVYRDSLLETIAKPVYEFDIEKEDYPTAKPAKPYFYPFGDSSAKDTASTERLAAIESAQDAVDITDGEDYTAPEVLPYNEEESSDALDNVEYQKARWSAWVSARKSWIESGELGQPPSPVFDPQDYLKNPGPHPDYAARNLAFLEKDDHDWHQTNDRKVDRLTRAVTEVSGAVTSYSGLTDYDSQMASYQDLVHNWEVARDSWYEVQKLAAATSYKDDCDAYSAKLQTAFNSSRMKKAREKGNYLRALGQGGGLYPCGVMLQKAQIYWTYSNPTGPDQEIIALNEISKHLDRISQAYVNLGKVDFSHATNSWSFDSHADGAFLPVGIVTLDNWSNKIPEIQGRVRQLTTLRWPMLLRPYDTPTTEHSESIHGGAMIIDLGEDTSNTYQGDAADLLANLPAPFSYPLVSFSTNWYKFLGASASHSDETGQRSILANGYAADIATTKGSLAGTLILASKFTYTGIRDLPTDYPPLDNLVRFHEFEEAPVRLGGSCMSFPVAIENDGPAYESYPGYAPSENKRLEGDHVLDTQVYKIARNYDVPVEDLGLPWDLPVPVNLVAWEDHENSYKIQVSGGTKSKLPGSQFFSDDHSLGNLGGESVMLFSPTFSHIPTKPFALASLAIPEPVFKPGVKSAYGTGFGLEIPIPIVDATCTTPPRLVLKLCDSYGYQGSGVIISYASSTGTSGIGPALGFHETNHCLLSHLELIGDRSDLEIESQDPPGFTDYWELSSGVFSKPIIYGLGTFDSGHAVIKKLTGTNGTLEIHWLGNYRFTLKYSYNGTEVITYEISAGGVTDNGVIASSGHYPSGFGEVTLKATRDDVQKIVGKATVVGSQTGVTAAHGEFARVDYFNDTGGVESTKYYVYEDFDPTIGTDDTPLTVLTKQQSAPMITDRFFVAKYAPPEQLGLNFRPATHEDWEVGEEEFINDAVTGPMTTTAQYNPIAGFDIGMLFLRKYSSGFLATPGASAGSYLPFYRYPKSRTFAGAGWAANGETLTFDQSGRMTNHTFKIAGLNAVQSIDRSATPIVKSTTVSGSTLATVKTTLSNGLARVVTLQDGLETATDYHIAETDGGLPWQVKSVSTPIGKTTYAYTKATNGDLTTVESFNPDAPGPDTITTTTLNKFGMLVSSSVKRDSVIISSAVATGHTSNAFRRPTSIALFSSGVSRTLSLVYNADGSLKKFEDGNGTTDEYVWDILGRIKSGTTLDGRAVIPHYDGLANSFEVGEKTISSEVDSYGKMKTFSNTAGLGVSVTKEVGETYKTTFEGGQRSFKRTFSDDGLPTIAGSGGGSPGADVSYSVATVNGKGCLVITSALVSESSSTPSVTKCYFDGLGRLVRVRKPHPMGTGTVDTDYAYDLGARTVTITPPSPSAEIVVAYEPGWMKAVATQGTTSREVSTTSSGADSTLTVKNAGRTVYQKQMSLATGIATSKINGRNLTTSTPSSDGNQVNITGPNFSYQVDHDRHGITGMSGTMAGKSFDIEVERTNVYVSKVIVDPPGPRGSTAWSFAETGRCTGALGPGVDMNIEYDYPDGGVKVTGTDTAGHKDFVTAHGPEGRPLRLSKAGKNDLSVEGNALMGSNTMLAAGFGTQAVNYTYGPQGHLLGMTRSDGSSVVQTWHDDGSLASVTHTDNAGSDTFEMTRDAATGYGSGYTTESSSLVVTPNNDGTIAKSIFTSKDIDNQTQVVSVYYPSYFDDFPLIEAFGGSLSGYEVRRNYNAATGDISRVELRKNSAIVHAVDYTPDAVSQIGTVTTSGSATFSATYNHSDTTETVTADAVTSTRTSLGGDDDGTGRLSSVSTTAGGNIWSATYGFSGQSRTSLILAAPGQPTTTWSYTFVGADGTGQLQGASSNQGMSYDYSHDGAENRTNIITEANNANQYTVFQIPGAQSYTVAGKVVPGATVKIAANGGAPHSVSVAADGTFSGSFAASATGNTFSSIPVEVVATLPGAGDAGANAIAASERSVILPPGNWSNTYGARGALASDWRWIYRWDPEGRLIGMITQDTAISAGMPKLKLKFAYDDMGRRIRKTVLHLTPNGSVRKKTETKFIYDEWRLLAEETTDDSTTAPVFTCYTWGKDIAGSLGETGGVGGLLAIHRNGASYVPVYDANGNITALVRSTNGAKVAAWSRGPFGEPISDSGATDLCPFGFATHYTDTETGLVYFGHRFYSPTSGRWLSREPLGEMESFNLYAYCHNDPVNKVDVLGLSEYEREQAQNLIILREAARIDPNRRILYAYASDQFWRRDLQGSPFAQHIYRNGGEERFIRSDLNFDHGMQGMAQLAAPVLVTAGGVAQIGSGIGLLMVPEPTMGTKVAGLYNIAAGADTLGGYYLTDDHKGLRQRGFESTGMSSGWAGGAVFALDVGVNVGAAFGPRLLSRGGSLPVGEPGYAFVAKSGGRTFFTVQGEVNASRLLADGAPWPIAPSEAHLGEGLYTWGSRSQAEAYMSLLESRGVSGLRIMEASVPEAQYNAFQIMDLRGIGDDAANAWLERHSSLFGEGAPHGLDHVIRDTGNFGPEFFFSKDVFPLLQLK